MGVGKYRSKEFSKQLCVGERIWLGTELEIGNPHLVFIAQDQLRGSLDDVQVLEGLDITALGREIEQEYPEGTNIEWLDIMPGTNRIAMRVWERGVGVTQACGSGSSASGFLLLDQGIKDGAVVVNNPGGDLLVSMDSLDDEVLLEGPSSYIGTITLAERFFSDRIRT